MNCSGSSTASSADDNMLSQAIGIGTIRPRSSSHANMVLPTAKDVAPMPMGAPGMNRTAAFASTASELGRPDSLQERDRLPQRDGAAQTLGTRQTIANTASSLSSSRVMP